MNLILLYSGLMAMIYLQKAIIPALAIFVKILNPIFLFVNGRLAYRAKKDVNRANYKRIQWHALNPELLIKQADYNPEEILASKTKFCNFLYSHKVPYREAFFTQLSKYKKVDAPGKSNE